MLLPSNTKIKKVEGSVPEGARVLSSDQLLNIQSRIIKDWTPQNEMWPFKVDAKILGTLAAASGLVFEHNYRKNFRLPIFSGKPSTVVTSMISPAIVSVLAHKVFVDEKIKLGQICPVCAEIRCASLMIGIGIGQPLLFSLVSSLAMAKLKYSIAIPSILHFKEWTQFVIKHSAPLKLPILGLIIVNAAVGTWFTREKLKAAEKVFKVMGMDDSGFESD